MEQKDKVDTHAEKGGPHKMCFHIYYYFLFVFSLKLFLGSVVAQSTNNLVEIEKKKRRNFFLSKT